MVQICMMYKSKMKQDQKHVPHESMLLQRIYQRTTSPTFSVQDTCRGDIVMETWKDAQPKLLKECTRNASSKIADTDEEESCKPMVSGL